LQAISGQVTTPGLGTFALLLGGRLILQAGGLIDVDDQPGGQFLDATDLSPPEASAGQTTALAPILESPIRRTGLRVAVQ